MNELKMIPLDEKYQELVRNWRNMPEVSAYMYSEEHISEQHHKKWFSAVMDDPASEYWVIEHNKKPLGLASITKVDYTLKSCYWAFYLGESAARGAGVGTGVELFIINHVFQNLGLNKLRCEVFTFNEKVIKMHEKFGFRREGYYREHCPKNGEFKDVVGLALLRKDWDRLKDGFRGIANGK